MDQQAEHSEIAGTEPRQHDEPAQVEPGPAVETDGSIFPDPFDEGPTSALRETPHSDSPSDIADDSVVDCMRESDLANAELTAFALNHGISVFDLEREREPVEAQASPPVSDPQETQAGTPVLQEISEAEAVPALDGSGNSVVGEPLSAALIVAAALEEVVSSLVGSVLQTVISPQTASKPDIAASKASDRLGTPNSALRAGAGTSAEDDHSYQWHAFQEDDEAGPAKPWEEEEPSIAAPVVEVKPVAVRPARRETASGDSTRPFKSGPEPVGSVVPGAASDGLLNYESTADPDRTEEKAGAQASRSGAWTIPLLCAGISIIACCLLIPLCDANRRAAYEKLRVRRDLESLQQQVATNDSFLHKVADDPTLAERLAQRQLGKIRAGTRVVQLKDNAPKGFGSKSALGIVAVAAPPPLAPYKPVGGRIATLCYNPHSRLYLMGVGLMLLAMGLVLGYIPIGISFGNMKT